MHPLLKKNPGSVPELFEGRLALTLGKILTPVSFSFDQKHFSGKFCRFFLEHQIIKLWTKRIKLIEFAF